MAEDVNRGDSQEDSEDSFDGRFEHLKHDPSGSGSRGDTKIIRENEQLRWEMMWHAMKDLHRELKAVKQVLDSHVTECEEDRNQLNTSLKEGRLMMTDNRQKIAELKVQTGWLMLALSGACFLLGLVASRVIEVLF